MKSLITIILIGLSAITSAAQEDSFDRLVEKIVATNPELAKLKASNAVESEAIKSENNLSDPEIEFTHQWGQHGIGTKWGIDLQQSFDWPGVYSARRRAGDAARRAKEIEYAVKRNDVAYEARCGITEAFYARKLMQLQQHQLDIIDSLQKVYSRGAERGEVSLLDVNKLKIERIRVGSRLTDAVAAYNDALGKLSQLSCAAAIDGIEDIAEYPSKKLLPASVYIKRAIDNSPVLALTRAQEKVEAENLSVINKSTVPGFSVGYMHEYELGEHFNGLKIGMTIPFFSNRHKKSEIAARKELIRLERTTNELKIESDISFDCKSVMRLDSDIAAYTEALTANDNPRLLGIALNARHITLVDYLTEMSYFLEAAEALIDLQLKRQLIMNRLERYCDR